MFTLPVYAKDFLTTQELYNVCQHGMNMYCYGFLDGIVGADVASGKWHKQETKDDNMINYKRFICKPVDVSIEGVRLTIMKHLNNHPEEVSLDRIAASTATHILKAAFPCTSGDTKRKEKEQPEAFLTGSQLLEHCKSYTKENETTPIGAVCFGYVMGTDDSHINFVVVGDLTKVWCMPLHMGSLQLIQIVVKYLKKHPELLHFSASSLVTAAFIEAFPCE